MVEGTGHVGLRCVCIQVLATLLHALPLKEDMEEWITLGRLFSFLHQNNPEQVTLLLELLPGSFRLQPKGQAEEMPCN